MHICFDEDEYETVIINKLCSVCHGDLRKCDGRCNGYFSISSKRRADDEIKKIKTKRIKEYEDKVLIEAELIKHRRKFLK